MSAAPAARRPPIPQPVPHPLARRPAGLPTVRRLAALLLVVTAAACGGDGATPSPNESLSISAIAGSAPSGPAGSRLLLAPLGIVRDASGAPASGAEVMLTLVGTGNAAAVPTLPETRIVSGPDGVARADIILGAVGTAQVRLTVTGAGDSRTAVVDVTATAPPTVTGIAPTTFGPGDEVTISGTSLTSETQGLAVTIGGVRATVLASSATSVRVRVPACVAAGQVPVTVTTALGTVAGTVTGTSTAGSGAAPSLQVFEGVTVPAARASECLSLLGGGARYLVVPQYATRDDVTGSVAAGASVGFTLGAPSFATVAALMPAPLAAPLAPQQRLDRALRMRERALAPMAAASGANPTVDVPPLAALTVNSTRTFQVLDDLDGDTYETVTARLRFLGENVLIYVDETAPPNGLTQAQLDGLGALFDRKLYPAVVNTFGSETDIDDNDRTIVLMSPVVNQLTTAAECAQFGYVTGFFYGLDLLPTQRNSNKGEIFYALVPDPTGRTGSCSHSVNEILRIVPATFVHEFQHMISWGQKVLVRGSAVDEELWLNEALSHIAEEVASMIYERECEGITTPPCRSNPQQVFPDSAQGFISGNFTNAFGYLRNSTQTSLTLSLDDASLEERGAGFLFLRWLGDQKGESIYRRLVETKMTGVQNLEDKAGEPWSRMFGDFSVAVYAADRIAGTTTTDVPQRYRFVSRDLRRIFRRFFDTQTEGVDRPFPIVPGVLSPDGSVSNAMVPGTMTWYTLTTGASASRVRLQFAPTGGGTFPAALGAQVTILRLPN